MRNVPINEAESIFEPFWDSGESYPGAQKYTPLTQYTVTGGRAEVAWNGVLIHAEGKTNGFTVCMARDCALDVTDYNVFRLSASVPKTMRVRAVCTVDGAEQTVLEAAGTDGMAEFDGALHGRQITHLRLEFAHDAPGDGGALLLWLGLSHTEKEARMLARKSPYDAQWAGCFAPEPALAPQDGIYFDASELDALRKKLAHAPFDRYMAALRTEAEAGLQQEPERWIGTYLHNGDKRWERARDAGKPVLLRTMEVLAFVGLIDENRAMLRMACRCALSAAHCTYFCESPMGQFPGATWHHRSFLEENVCRALCKVLDWAGGLLTWHGKNILYDAMIQKGLPRMDADIKTMDYMWHMNQGGVFASGLVTVLLTLEKRYPRYRARTEEAVQDMMTIWNQYTQPDGGTAEGPGYWNYTAGRVMEALLIWSHARGKRLSDTLPESMRRSGAFALAVLSDTGSGDTCVPVNDAHPGLRYDPFICAVYACAAGDAAWNRLYAQRLTAEVPAQVSVPFLIVATEPTPEPDAGQTRFASFPDTGHTVLSRGCAAGRVGLHAISGAITFGHCHCDKGSFVLERAGVPLLIDRGMCDYSNPNGALLSRTEAHNLLVPFTPEGFLQQNTDTPACSARVLQADFDGQHFAWTTDTTAAWNTPRVKEMRRTLTSDTAERLLVRDHAVFAEPTAAAFILNTTGTVTPDGSGWRMEENGACVQVRVQSGTPVHGRTDTWSIDGEGRPVQRLLLETDPVLEVDLVTELIIR